MRRTTLLAVLVMCALGVPCHHSCVGAAEQPRGARDAQVDALLDAISQAQRPTDNMRIRLTRDVVKPVITGPPVLAEKYPGGIPPMSLDYTITLSGIRSRVERYQRQYETGASDSAYRLLHWIEVFDGTEQRRLTYRPDGSLRGARALQRAGSGDLGVVLFPYLVSVSNDTARGKYSYRLLPGPEAQVRILEAVSEYGALSRFHVDAGRGNNVTKIETTRADGKPQDLINYSYKQTPGGIWYVGEVEHIRYTLDGGEPFVTETIKVLDAEFNIEIPEETFRLDFPQGTKVLDMVLHSSYFVGAPPEPVFERESFGSPNTPEQEAQEGGMGGTLAGVPSDKTSRTEASTSEPEAGPRGKARDSTTSLMLVLPVGVGLILLALLAYVYYLRKT